MKRARYHRKDLIFALGKSAKVDDRVAIQEMVVRSLHGNGKPLDLDNELLMRLYERRRLITDRVKRIEAALGFES